MEAKSRHVVRAALLAALTVHLAGCFNSDDDKRRSAASHAEITLMEDKSNAVPELLKRLHEKVMVRSGIFLIDDDALGWTAISSPVRWKIDCGFLGVKISLIYRSGSVDDDGTASATLAQTSLSNELCKDYIQELALDAQHYLLGQFAGSSVGTNPVPLPSASKKTAAPSSPSVFCRADDPHCKQPARLPPDFKCWADDPNCK